MSDESLRRICRSSPKLRSLRIRSRYAGGSTGLNLTPNIIPFIANSLPALEVLQISPLAVSDFHFQELGTLTNLQVVHLESRLVSDFALRRLGRLKNLRYLFLPVTEYISPRGLHFLPKAHSKLQYLIFSPLSSLPYSRLINGRVLRNLRHLCHLDLSRCKVDDRVLTSLGTLRHLRFLNLSECSLITDDGMINLCRPQSPLEYLNLNGCRNISDVTMTHLSTHCPHLRDLSIARCQRVTDFGLLALADIQTIKFIDVDGCKLISEQAIIDLIDNLPDFRNASTQYIGPKSRVRRHLDALTSEMPEYEIMHNRDDIAMLQNDEDQNAEAPSGQPRSDVGYPTFSARW